MVYNVIGLMSGSSLDGLDIAYCELTETGGQWQYKILHATCVPLPHKFSTVLPTLHQATVAQYLHCDTELAAWMASQVNEFITTNQLSHKVHLIGSHGHTITHQPHLGYTSQIGCGATLAAHTGIAVVANLRQMDIAYGGQGAPIVPIADKLLFNNYTYLLNIGGIANITFQGNNKHIAFDVCAANRVLNELCLTIGKPYDDGGQLAMQGTLIDTVLQQLNALPYYTQAAPKSLDNQYGMQVVLPMLSQYSAMDMLHTYCVHIAIQITNAIKPYCDSNIKTQLLITGGGAYNLFLVASITQYLQPLNIEVIVPDNTTIEYKEALAMALIATLRWREETNVLASVTGAKNDSVGGALWLPTL
jgi:anhydro-N-acetylmuramic acid kinase